MLDIDSLLNGAVILLDPQVCIYVPFHYIHPPVQILEPVANIVVWDLVSLVGY